MALTTHNPYTQAAGSLVSILTTELNALANSSNSAASTTPFDNRTVGDEWAEVEINIGAQTARTGTPTLEVYILRTIDDTNYDTLDPVVNDRIHTKTITLPTTTAAYRIILAEVAIPPGLFKFYFRNLTSQALAASGNTVKIRTRSIKTV